VKIVIFKNGFTIGLGPLVKVMGNFCQIGVVFCLTAASNTFRFIFETLVLRLFLEIKIFSKTVLLA